MSYHEVAVHVFQLFNNDLFSNSILQEGDASRKWIKHKMVRSWQFPWTAPLSRLFGRLVCNWGKICVLDGCLSLCTVRTPCISLFSLALTWRPLHRAPLSHSSKANSLLHLFMVVEIHWGQRSDWDGVSFSDKS